MEIRSKLGFNWIIFLENSLLQLLMKNILQKIIKEKLY